MEGPSTNFQIVRDILDIVTAYKKGFFNEELKEAANGKKISSMEGVRSFPQKVNLSLAKEISQKCKITVSQAKRIFDLVYLISLNEKDDMHMTAYKGYMRRKLEKNASRQFLQATSTKHIEFYGEVEEVDYSQFNPAPQDCK